MYQMIPNTITILRIFVVPIIIYLLLQKSFGTSFWVIFVAGLSDGLDGYVAKRFNAVTRLGTYLDPIADKILLVAVFGCLGYIGIIPIWVVYLLIMRDFLILCGVAIMIFVEVDCNVEPIASSKLNTFLQIVLIMSCLGQASMYFDMENLIVLLNYVVALTTIVSLSLIHISEPTRPY